MEVSWFYSLFEKIAGLHLHHRLGRIEGDTERVAPIAHGLDLTAQQPAKVQPALVAGREVLFGMQADRPLPDLRLPIAGKTLMLFLAKLVPRAAIVITRRHRLEILRHFARVEQAEMRVVDRHHPADAARRAIGEPYI